MRGSHSRGKPQNGEEAAFDGGLARVGSRPAEIRSDDQDAGPLTLSVSREGAADLEVAPVSLGASRVAGNVIVLGLAQLATWLSTGVAVVLMPRFLGDTNSGKFAICGTLLGFLSIAADLGTTGFLAREIARTGSRQTTARYVANSLALRLPLTIVTALAGVAVINLLGYDSEVKLVFYLMLPGLLLIATNQILGAGLQGLQEMRPMAFAGAIARALQVALTIGLLAAGEGIVEIAPVTWIPAFIGLGAGSYALFRRVGFSLQIDANLCRRIVTSSLPFLLWNVSLAIYGSIDIVMLSLMTNSAVVGWYSAAYRIIGVPVFIPVILGMALMPALSQTARADTDSFKTMLRQSLRISLVTMMPLALGTVVLPDKIVALLGWPEEFRHSIPLMAILALHMPIVGVTTALGSALIAVDRQRAWALVGVGAAIINPAFNLIFIPLTQHAYGNGAIGAAGVTVCTEVLMLTMALRLMPRGILGRETADMAMRCVAAGGLMVPAVWLARDLGLIPCVVLGAFVYGSASFVLKTVTRADAEQVATYFRDRLFGNRRGAAQPSGESLATH